MHRILRRSIPPSLRAIERASRRSTLCFVVHDDENKTSGMIVRDKNLPAEVGKAQPQPRSASEVIAEMAAKVARYPAKPKEEWEGMSAEEMYQQGEKYYEEEEYAEAVKWYRRAAEQGHAEAQWNLGLAYADGKGILKDDAEAVKWIHRAAEQEDIYAQTDLGWMYQNGDCVPQDYAEAAKWYRRAAEQGHASAQTRIGTQYYFGEGVPQDYAEAVKWYRRAAEQGDAEAQLNLSNAYSDGKGVPQNEAEAVKWYRRSYRRAGQGNAKAKNAYLQLKQKK